MKTTHRPTKRCRCGNSFNSIEATRACTGHRLVEIKNDKQCYMLFILIPLMSSTNQIYHRASSLVINLIGRWHWLKIIYYQIIGYYWNCTFQQMPHGSKHGNQGSNKKSVQSNDVNQAWFTTRDDKQALQNTGIDPVIVSIAGIDPIKVILTGREPVKVRKFKWLEPCLVHHKSTIGRKRKRSDSVLWQKPPYTHRKFQKVTWQHKKRHQKLQLHNDCGPTWDGQME